MESQIGKPENKPAKSIKSLQLCISKVWKYKTEARQGLTMCEAACDKAGGNGRVYNY